jgi:hypothetical protein
MKWAKTAALWYFKLTNLGTTLFWSTFGSVPEAAPPGHTPERRCGDEDRATDDANTATVFWEE